MSALRTLAFVYLSAVVAVVFSERVFWFWTPGLVAHAEGAAYYSLPVAVTVWAVAWFRVSTAWALLLVTPLYAYITEGVLTPVMYSGGPFVPFFPAWFAAWHGLGAIFVLWYWVRRWLLAGAWKLISALAAGVGVFWGVWASTLRLPEHVDDPDMVADIGRLTVLGPRDFAIYAALITAVLVVAHLGLDRVWPRQWHVGERSTRAGTVIVTMLAAAWTVVIPWALPMFVVYGMLQVRSLRRHRTVSSGPNIVEQLAGPIDVRHLAPLLLIVPTASASYLALWVASPSELVLRVIYYGIISVQTVIGCTVSLMAWRRSGCVARVADRKHSEPDRHGKRIFRAYPRPHGTHGHARWLDGAQSAEDR